MPHCLALQRVGQAVIIILSQNVTHMKYLYNQKYINSRSIFSLSIEIEMRKGRGFLGD